MPIAPVLLSTTRELWFDGSSAHTPRVEAGGDFGPRLFARVCSRQRIERGPRSKVALQLDVVESHQRHTIIGGVLRASTRFVTLAVEPLPCSPTVLRKRSPPDPAGP